MLPTGKIQDNLSKQGAVVQVGADVAASLVASKADSLEPAQHKENKIQKEGQNNIISDCIKNLATMNNQLIMSNLLRYGTAHTSSETMKNVVVGMCHIAFLKSVSPILKGFEKTGTILLQHFDKIKLFLVLGNHPVIGDNLKENQDFKQLSDCLKSLLMKDEKPEQRASTIKEWVAVKLDFNAMLLAFLKKKRNNKKIRLYYQNKIFEGNARLTGQALTEYPKTCDGAIKNIQELMALEKETIELLDAFINGKPLSHEYMDCLMNLNECYSDTVIEPVMAEFCRDLKDKKCAEDQKKLVEMIASSKSVEGTSCSVRVIEAVVQNGDTRAAFSELAKSKGVDIKDWLRMFNFPSSEEIVLDKLSKVPESPSSPVQTGAGAGAGAGSTVSSARSGSLDAVSVTKSESKKSGCGS